ncbi:MAG: Fic family protein [Fimbriimonadaceae bacterium]
MKALNTLTVQDMMWVNMQICKRQMPWNFATLEEATFNQYSYGDSMDLVGQAARFLTGFAKLMPFVKGNEATAFVGMVAFLGLNGMDLHLDDAGALDWVNGVLGEDSAAGVRAKLEVLIEEHDLHLHHGVPDVRGIMGDVLARFPETVAALMKSGHQAALV